MTTEDKNRPLAAVDIILKPMAGIGSSYKPLGKTRYVSYKVWKAGDSKSQMCLYPLHQRTCVVLVEVIARLVFLPMHVHSCRGGFLIQVSETRARLSR